MPELLLLGLLAVMVIVIGVTAVVVAGSPPRNDPR